MPALPLRVLRAASCCRSGTRTRPASGAPSAPHPAAGQHVSVSLGNGPPRRLLSDKRGPPPRAHSPAAGRKSIPRTRRCCCEERRVLVAVRAHKGRPAVPTAPPRAGPMPGRPPARLPAPKAAVLQCPRQPALPQSCCPRKKSQPGKVRGPCMPTTSLALLKQPSSPWHAGLFGLGKAVSVSGLNS